VHSAWTSKREFGTIAGELAQRQDRDFERAVLPYVRAIWPKAWISPSKQKLDSAGIDIYVGKPPHFQVVIQCKGFLERDLLADQIAQCRTSIEAFLSSRYTTEKYYLLHNRHIVTREYVAALGPVLDALKPLKAKEPSLWNHRNLLVAAFDATETRVRGAIVHKTEDMRREQELAERIIGGEPLRQVPVATSEMRINAARLRSTTTPVVTTADPLGIILAGNRRRIGVVIAPAGFGKTTTGMRALRERSSLCVLLPAARIRGDMANAHSMFETSLDPQDVVGDVRDEDREAWLRMVGTIMKYLTQSEKEDMVIIIDALDEAPALERSFDLHRFFNMLGRTRVAIVITMRKEFWSSRRSDFDATLGGSAERESTTQTLRLIELLPWEDAQVIAATEACFRSTSDRSAKKRLSEFLVAVQSGGFTKTYSDILRTPLFLKFTLDILQEQDLTGLRRGDLVMHWSRLKIARDVTAPVRFGGRRVRIRYDVVSVDDTIAASFAAMQAAAEAMCRREGGMIELLPACRFEDIRNAIPANAPDSPTSLMLNSLLIPTEDRRMDGSQSMRFAHRVFHEFFLARAIVKDTARFADAKLPWVIREWVDDLTGI
jgi:hypothetical protein